MTVVFSQLKELMEAFINFPFKNLALLRLMEKLSKEFPSTQSVCFQTNNIFWWWLLQVIAI